MKQWYLLAYDVRENKRLNRLHYFVKKRATALQNSVFILYADSQHLDELMQGLKKRAKPEDDIRLYPIAGPNSIWAAGRQVGSLEFVFTPDRYRQNKSSWIGDLFRRKTS